MRNMLIPMKPPFTDEQLQVILKEYRDYTTQNPKLSSALCAVQIMIFYLQKSTGSTLAQLHLELSSIKDFLTDSHDVPAISSACELFMRYISLKDFDHHDFDNIKNTFLHRGNQFLENALNAKYVIAKSAKSFVRDGSVILTHSCSKVVFEILKAASEDKVNFDVYVSKCSIDNSGLQMHKKLKGIGIQSTVVADAGVGFVMERVDFVLMGAHAIAESGGAINKLGSYSIALMAKQLNIPLYVASESFKLLRVFPILQNDLKNRSHYTEYTETGDPKWDYTPPTLISLHFSDVGVYTTSAISDEMIKLYT